MPLVKLIQERDDTKIGIWKVEESVTELKNQLILNEEEIRFFNSLNKNKRNLHWLSSRVLLRTLINTPDFIEVYGDEHGKPHLLNFDFEISISHSYDYAAVMISRKASGIDIEKIKPVITRIAPKFLHPDELKEVDIQHDIKKLYVIWCAKESVYKMNGKKGLIFRENIILNTFDFKESGGKVSGIYLFNNNWIPFEISYLTIDGYLLTYVIKQ